MARARSQLLLPVLLVVAACGRAGDGAAAAGRDTAQAREAVLGLERELFQSYVRGDTAPSARILAADYVGITGDGHRETKAQALANLRRDGATSAEATRDSIRVDSTIARVYGDAVVAQTSGTFLTHDGQQRVGVGFQNTDVFVWRDGRWQIVATHLSRVAGAQGRSPTP